MDSPPVVIVNRETGAVKDAVLAPCADEKVLTSVVVLDAIQMMHDLIGSQGTTERLLRYDDMLKAMAGL